jgi:predicted dehydrogenase
MGQVRIGFVGSGGIARAHLRRLKEIDEAEVVALSDVSEAAVQSASEEFGGTAYSDYQKMLGSEQLDAVYVCVPPHAHGTIEVDCAARGLHIFVEKPVTLYIDVGLRAQEAIAKAGVITGVGYSMRYGAGAAVLKEFLQGKQVGAAVVHRWCSLINKSWWRRYDQGGGQLVEMITHQVDLLRYVLGEVKAVHASYGYELTRPIEDATVPDTQVATLIFESGTVASILGFCMTKDVYHGTCEFWLDNMRVVFGRNGLQVQPDGAEVPEAPKDLLGIDEAFIKAIDTGDTSSMRTDYADGLKSAEVVIACNRSADAGGALVELPLTP